VVLRELDAWLRGYWPDFAAALDAGDVAAFAPGGELSMAIESAIMQAADACARLEGHPWYTDAALHYNNPVRLGVVNNPDWRKVETWGAGNQSDTTYPLVQRVADELLIERMGQEWVRSRTLGFCPERIKAEIEACLRVIEATLTHGLSYLAWRRRKAPMWAELFDVARAHAATLPVKILPSSDANAYAVLPVYTSEQELVYGLAPWETTT
jgi:hypothetical protein